MKNLLLLILSFLIFSSAFSQTYNPVYGKQDFRDTIKLSKLKNNAAGDYILSTDTAGRVIKVLPTGGGSGTDSAAIRSAKQPTDSVNLYLSDLKDSTIKVVFVGDTSGGSGGIADSALVHKGQTETLWGNKTFTGTIRIPALASTGKVLTSDASGNGTWDNGNASYWRIRGNTGTDTSMFAGNIDNQQYAIRVNNRPAILVNPETGFGFLTQFPGATNSFAYIDTRSDQSVLGLHGMTINGASGLIKAKPNSTMTLRGNTTDYDNNVVIQRCGACINYGSILAVGVEGQPHSVNILVDGSTSIGGPSIDIVTKLDVQSTVKGVKLSRMTTAQKVAITSQPLTGTIVGGSGYTNGSYSLSASGGSGTGAALYCVVIGGTVTTVSPSQLGTGYLVGDVLTSAIPGGSGFTYTITALTGSLSEGLEVYDLTLHQKSYFNGTAWINY